MMPAMQAFSSLGEFEQLVLLAVMQLGDDAYAVPVRELIVTRAGRDVARGALYTALDGDGRVARQLEGTGRPIDELSLALRPRS